MVRVRLAPDRPSQPFLIVLGAPLVPWDFEINTRQALGADATVGHGRLVPRPPMIYPMGFCTHRSTRASADAGNALDHMVNGSADVLLPLDGFQALCLMIISASNAPSDDSPWAPLFLVGSPALPENELPQLALSSESGTMEGLYVHFAALPLPPSHGLPLSFVAQPAAMTWARKLVDALERWSGLTDARWDYLDNPYFDVWFTAQAINPEPFVINLRSIPHPTGLVQVDGHHPPAP